MIANKIDYGIAIKQLNELTKAYDEGRPLVSDEEWDDLYFEVKDFENRTNIKFKDSPTQKISYTVVNKLEKVTHNHSMLSLDKTKDVEELYSKFGNKEWIAMAKMDGLTISLLYQNGILKRAETRGNGTVGEDVTHNAKVVPSIPKRISITDRKVIVDGEMICTYKDFEQFKDKYKNPRNFASGSIRLLDSKECSKRHLTFIAWDCISGVEAETLSEKLDKLAELGFYIVPHGTSDPISCDGDYQFAIDNIKKRSELLGYPIDGVVFKVDNCTDYAAAGETSHHPSAAIAYKFYEETYSTILRDIEWSMGRTGVLSPIAIFDPVEMDGSTCARASVHNISILYQTLGKHPYIGEPIETFKALQIVPQIYSAEKLNNPPKDKELKIPTICPFCGEPLVIKNERESESEILYCPNEKCPSRYVNILDHIYGKNGLDIKGISKMTIQKLIDWGWLQHPVDLLYLNEHKAEWSRKPGFGVKSVERVLDSIETSIKSVPVWRCISAAGIPQVGITASKQLAKRFVSWCSFRKAVTDNFDFTQLPDFGEVADYEIKHFDFTDIDAIADNLTFDYGTAPVESDRANLNKTFVITGKLKGGNREWLKDKIEAVGGKVASSVSTKTDYLINNDINSTSSKNVKAKSLNIPIITENEVLKMLGE